MDQDSFRNLLSKPSGSTSTSTARTSRGSKLGVSKPTAKTIDASQPAFKPRKVKEVDSKYRDRATERRTGQAGDFAHVEAVLTEFEKQAKEAKDQAEVEEKRKYLGGDGEHSVLVKGLDFALLEQQKARAALANEAADDDTLEQVFSESVAAKPKKRTREDLLRELKEKKAGGAGAAAPSDSGTTVVSNSKFKPIGFKPIGAAAEGKKKKKVKGEAKAKDGERKSKKRKVEAGVSGEPPAKEPTAATEPSTSTATATVKPAEPEPEPINDDFDIFTDAAEYEGLDLGDDDDDEAEVKHERAQSEHGDTEPSLPRKWIDTEQDTQYSASKEPVPAGPPKRRSPTPELQGYTRPPIPLDDEEEDDMDVDRPMRLVPLASSSIDVKELLQMDKASASWTKNKKKKDKKKASGGGGGGDGEAGSASSKVSEAKIERDYKRLKAYTDKKTS